MAHHDAEKVASSAGATFSLIISLFWGPYLDYFTSLNKIFSAIICSIWIMAVLWCQRWVVKKSALQPPVIFPLLHLLVYVIFGRNKEPHTHCLYSVWIKLEVRPECVCSCQWQNWPDVEAWPQLAAPAEGQCRLSLICTQMLLLIVRLIPQT